MHVIATAGHVDHGKSMLVRVLTGMEPDRWEDERRRGMTIDLGFAWTSLPSGEQIAFVDVPGHERFVGNMLAGAGPAPAVLFVVAADEGWKPQSAEHLAAIDAFGVRHGVLAITRADLADPEPARREAAGQLARTSLGADVEAVAVSALTGAGIGELIAALDRLVARLPRPDPDGPVRLWLDRAFAIKGSGTVVTGTLQAGTVRPGDELALTPALRRLRIRGVQALGTPAAQVSGVARAALNLRGVGAAELSRGMALIGAGQWTVTKMIDVRLRGGGAVDQPPDLPPQVTVHIGAARTVARVRVLGGALARLTLAHPLPLHVGDRLLLRDPGAAPGRAGHPVLAADVLDPAPPQLRGSGAAARAAAELAAWPDPPAAGDLLRRHRLLRMGTATAMGLRDLPAPVAGDWLADPGHWLALRTRLAEIVAAHAARDPLALGLPADAARARLGLPDRRLVEALAAQNPAGAAPVSASGGYLRPGGAAGSAGADRTAAAIRALLDGLADAPFGAPDSTELQRIGLDQRTAAAAERAGLLLRLPGNVLLAPDALDQAARILAALPQPFTAADARKALETSRRVVIPLLERLDREGICRRLPDDRRVMRDQAG